MSNQRITVETEVNSDAATVWEHWVSPEHITKWNFASDDWHCPHAENDPRTGGKFSATMAAKDGSASFEFGGVYSEVIPQQSIRYAMEDGREVEVKFEESNGRTKVTETFDAEGTHPVEMQRAGWQMILENFRKHVESNAV